MSHRDDTLPRTGKRPSNLAGLGLLTAVVALAIVLTACAAGSATSEHSSESVPMLGGAALYEQHCGGCHGVDLKGTDRGPSQLSVVYAPDHHPDESYRSAIANGVKAHHWSFGDMAPVKDLSPDEVDELISYIRAQQDQHGLEPYPPN